MRTKAVRTKAAAQEKPLTVEQASAKEPAKEPAPAAKSRTITPNRLELKQVVLIVEGTGKGYLSNCFPEDVAKGIADKGTGQGGAKVRKIRDPDAEYRGSLRVDEQKRCCMPASGFKKAMLRASKATGAAMTDTNGTFQILDELLPIEDAQPCLHRRTVKDGHIAYCAMFQNHPRKPWVVRVPITYDAAQTTPEVLVDLMNRAGFFVGIGAWRPEKNGSMGMFKVRSLG